MGAFTSVQSLAKHVVEFHLSFFDSVLCGPAFLLFLVEIMHEPKLYPRRHARILSTTGFWNNSGRYNTGSEVALRSHMRM
jgi:hypothetical protein